MDNGSQEKLNLRPSFEQEKKVDKQKPLSAKEVKKRAAELLRDQESAEGQEGVELSEGKVGEVAGEDKAHAPMGGAGGAMTDDQREAIRAKLLAALPPQEIMVKQIRKKLNQEEKILTKKFKKLRRKSHLHANELSIVVAQLRKVREYFSLIAHATYEMIKHLWLKIVHGV